MNQGGIESANTLMQGLALKRTGTALVGPTGPQSGGEGYIWHSNCIKYVTIVNTELVRPVFFVYHHHHHWTHPRATRQLNDSSLLHFCQLMGHLLTHSKWHGMCWTGTFLGEASFMWISISTRSVSSFLLFQTNTKWCWPRA